MSYPWISEIRFNYGMLQRGMSTPPHCSTVTRTVLDPPTGSDIKVAQILEMASLRQLFHARMLTSNHFLGRKKSRFGMLQATGMGHARLKACVALSSRISTHS